MSDRLKAVGKALVMDPERTKDPVDFVQRLLQVGWCACGWGGGSGVGGGGVARVAAGSAHGILGWGRQSCPALPKVRE